MKVITLTFNNFGENTYIVYDPSTLDCAVIDPGMMNDGEQRKLKEVIDRQGLHPVHVINTHMHIDHVLGNHFLSKEYGLSPEAHKEDAFLGERVAQQALMFGMPVDVQDVPVNTYLNQGDIIRIGEGELKVLHVPGHSPGSIALYDKQDGFVITGDALFAGSIGRTDLPGGSHPTLISAIRRELFTLPPETKVYPGHGPSTTIGAESRSNPFF